MEAVAIESTLKNKLLLTWIVLTAGFSVFAMFFGSGNLVFPLNIGKLAGQEYTLAMIGLFFAGILIPSLGLFGIIVYRGSLDSFFGVLGNRAKFFIPSLILALIGPFGVIPRCVNVAHGSLQVVYPDLSLAGFSLIFCAVTYLILRRSTSMVEIVGGFLTPFLLLSLGLIIFFAIFNTPIELELKKLTSLQALHLGVSEGYQTMDLLAAFFFAAAIVRHLNDKFEKHTHLEFDKPKFTVYAILLGGGLLAIVYTFMVYLGFKYAPLLKNIPPEQMISFIAHLSLGSSATIIVAIAVILACLTTAVALAKASTDFLQTKIFKNNLSQHNCLLIVLAITFLFSLLRFDGLARILGPTLQIIYPALILLCVLNIISRFYKLKHIYIPVYAMAITSAAHYFMG